MGCRTRLSRYLQSFFINPQCPLGAIPIEAASMDVHPDEVTNALKREAPVAFLETENSKADEHLSASEVGSGWVKSLLSPSNQGE